MNTKNSLKIYLFAIIAIILTLISSLSLTIAIICDYTVEIGHFEASSILAPTAYIAMGLGLILATVAACLNRNTEIMAGRRLSTVHSFAAALCGFLLISAVIFDIYIKAFASVSTIGAYTGILSAGNFASTLVYAASVFGILGGLSLILIAVYGSLRTIAAKLLAFGLPFYFLLRTLLLYLERSHAINSPLKILVMLAFVSLSIMSIFDLGLYIYGENLYPKYIFGALLATVINGTVALSSLICFAVSKGDFVLSAVDSAMLCAFFFLSLMRLDYASKINNGKRKEALNEQEPENE